MLLVRYLRENSKEAIDALKRRGYVDAHKRVEDILAKDEDRRKTQLAVDTKDSELKEEREKLLEEKQKLTKERKKLEEEEWKKLLEARKKLEEEEERKLKGEIIKLIEERRKLEEEEKKLIEEIKNLTKERRKLEEEEKKLIEEIKNLTKEREKLKAHEAALQELVYQLPNIPHQDVPDGLVAADNVVSRGSADTASPTPSGQPLRPHWDLIGAEGLDFSAASVSTGRGFVFFRGQVARLVRGLTHFFLDKAVEAGYEEIMPPLLVNEASATGTGQLPDKTGQMYRLEADPYYLIPTAEVPLTNLLREQIVPHKQLPVRYVGYTPCFRREAGSWGAKTRGLNRLHQFDKVEIVQICKPEESYDILEKMVTHVESLLQSLELPYKLLQLCAGELGFASAMTYDFECYAKGQKRWLEVSSVSNFEDFQARRMKMRYRPPTGKVAFVHTLNGSALALPRVLACLLENGQATDHIKLPKVLVPYTGFDSLARRV